MAKKKRVNRKKEEEKMAKKKRVNRKKEESSGRWQRAIIGLLMALIMVGSVIALLFQF
jgi:cobalamin biosynthesis Mg chelatase CobN